MRVLTAIWAFTRTPLGMVLLHAVEALDVIAVLWALKAGYDHKHEAIGAARVQVQFDAYKAAATKRSTDLALLWAAKVDEAATAQTKLDTERQQRIDDAKKQAQQLPPSVASVRIPAAAVRVLDYAAGNSEAPKPAAEPATNPAPAPEDSNLGIVTQWAVTVIGYYNACRDEVIGWQSFYHSLQEANP